MANSDDKVPPSPKLGPGSIPQLPRRAWWFYLAVSEAQSFEDLVSSSGLAKSSVRSHIRTLSNAGLVRTDSAGRYIHAVSLPRVELSEITEHVAKANFSGKQPVPVDVRHDVRHEVGFHNPVRRGNDWYTLVRCACGWRREVLAGDASSASRQARELWAAHAPASWHRAYLIGNAALAAVALVMALLVGLVGVKVVGSFSEPDDKPDDTTNNLPSDPDGPDCDRSVAYLMTQEYGGVWGSGKWPDGEYPRRVAQCEGR